MDEILEDEFDDDGLEVDEDDVCDVAFEVALDRAMENCLTDESAIESISGVLGTTAPDDVDDVLDEGLTEDICEDREAIRQWVVANTWELMEENELSLTKAMAESWNEVDTEC